MSKYPTTHSIVEVTFNEGDVKQYVISASPTVGGHLTRQAGETGILSLYNAEESYAIPLCNIREWKIVHRPQEEDDQK